MSAYASHGVDLMIDLEHQSLEGLAPADPTARDARGWAKLEVRPGPELWAVNVTWTPDGEARLRQKRQRYVSPVVDIDEGGRALAIFNVAITALPATDHAPALVAARMQTLAADAADNGDSVDAKDVKAALEAIKSDDKESALAILEAMLVQAASGESAEAPAEEAPAMAEEPPPAEEEEKKEAYAAMAATSRELLALSGRETPGEALEDVKAWRAAYLELAAERGKIDADRKRLEATERRGLVAQLVKLSAETPATAWSDAKGSKPCKRLEGEPIAELRDRVAKLSAAKGGKRDPLPPVADTLGLSERELSKCKVKGVDPAKYARTKALMARSAAPKVEV